MSAPLVMRILALLARAAWPAWAALVVSATVVAYGELRLVEVYGRTLHHYDWGDPYFPDAREGATRWVIALAGVVALLGCAGAARSGPGAPERSRTWRSLSAAAGALVVLAWCIALGVAREEERVHCECSALRVWWDYVDAIHHFGRWSAAVLLIAAVGWGLSVSSELRARLAPLGRWGAMAAILGASLAPTVGLALGLRSYTRGLLALDDNADPAWTSLHTHTTAVGIGLGSAAATLAIAAPWAWSHCGHRLAKGTRAVIAVVCVALAVALVPRAVALRSALEPLPAGYFYWLPTDPGGCAERSEWSLERLPEGAGPDEAPDAWTTVHVGPRAALVNEWDLEDRLAEQRALAEPSSWGTYRRRARVVVDPGSPMPTLIKTLRVISRVGWSADFAFQTTSCVLVPVAGSFAGVRDTAVVTTFRHDDEAPEPEDVDVTTFETPRAFLDAILERRNRGESVRISVGDPPDVHGAQAPTMLLRP